MTAPLRPRVFIVGGGFAGLAAAKALAGAPVDVTIFDRRNHHVFQPLLYQVATAALSPADISAPIRSVVRDQENCEVLLAEVIGVDVKNRRLILGRGHTGYDYLILAAGATHAYFGHDQWAPIAPGLKSIEDATEMRRRILLAEVIGVDVKNRRLILGRGHTGYDYLILAAGATHAYFGHDQWAPIAPGLKSIEDATEMRRRILLAFESAEYEASPEARRAALTFGIVGGGPTGVELAGAIKEIAGETIPRDYKHIDTRTTRVILFEGASRLLPTFVPELSARAQRDLERMGVEVRLNSLVTNVTREGISIGSEFIAIRNVFWAAGVKASPLGESLGVPLDRAGRVIVGADLTIPGHSAVFVTGDMAAATSADTGAPVPGVAQGGIQMGRYAGETIAREVEGRSTPEERKPFVYHDKGSMAVIGKAKAVAQIGRLKLRGFIAWLVWGGIHIAFLIGFRNRVQVLLSWLWNWVLNARDARLITGDAHLDVRSIRADEFVEEPEPAHSRPDRA